MRVDSTALEFEWDKGNIGKSKKHKVEDQEAEEVFLDKHKFIFKDTLHSQYEGRFRILGKTKKGKLLFVVFAKRGEKGKKVRIISARDINRKEIHLYEEKIKVTKV